MSYVKDSEVSASVTPKSSKPVTDEITWDSEALDALISGLTAKQETTYRLLLQHMNDTSKSNKKLERELQVIKELLVEALAKG